MFQKTRLNNGSVGRIPKMSDVVKMYLAGWVPWAGLLSRQWLVLMKLCKPGGPRVGLLAGVSCLGPHAPPPENALEAAPVSTETGGQSGDGQFCLC